MLNDLYSRHGVTNYKHVYTDGEKKQAETKKRGRGERKKKKEENKSGKVCVLQCELNGLREPSHAGKNSLSFYLGTL